MEAMTDYRHFRSETDDEGIVWLTFDKAESGTNVFSPDVLEELDRALQTVAAEKPRGLVILSGKPNGFIAGADIKSFTGVKNRDDAMAFGEHLGEPPGFYGYVSAGMRLVDNNLRKRGEVIFAEAHYVHDLRTFFPTTPWRLQAPQDLMYGGACHPVDLLRWFLLFVIIEQMGEAELASANIIYSCFLLFMIFIESISEAVCSMTSNLLGRGRRAEMPKLIRKSMQLGYFVVAPLLLVALLFPEEVLSIFTPDAAIIELSLSGYTIVLLALVLAIPGDMLYAAVVGTGDTRATLGIQLVATAAALAFTLWAALVMSLPLGMVLFVEIIVWTLYLLLSWYWLRSGRWRQLKV